MLGFDLFYLLQNPQATTAHATVNFLLPSGTTISRTYTLAPGSRTTIYVNQVEGLDETDVSGGVSADAPIVVERAMYRSLPGQPFALGTNSMGVPAAATSWFLAEGATGAFFDLYVLIANPGSTDASVTARYAKPDGTVVTQTYTVRAHSRFSVYVDGIPGLETTAVATTLTSTNAVPIVAERAMYWPGGFFDYYEGHSSAGSTSTALEWVVSGGQNGGADSVRTFVLIANTASNAGRSHPHGAAGSRLHRPGASAHRRRAAGEQPDHRADHRGGRGVRCARGQHRRRTGAAGGRERRLSQRGRRDLVGGLERAGDAGRALEHGDSGVQATPESPPPWQPLDRVATRTRPATLCLQSRHE